MPYIKTTWAKGDVVTSSKLNNMEDGIEAIDTAQSSSFAPDIDNPQDGQVLVYDGTAGKWVNGAGGGGMVTVGSIDLTAMTVTLNKTAGELWTAFTAGRHVTAKVDDVPPFSVNVAFGLIYAVDKGNQGYSFTFYDGDILWGFDAENAQAYPAYSLS